jgi:hypothetical protein
MLVAPRCLAQVNQTGGIVIYVLVKFQENNLTITLIIYFRQSARFTKGGARGFGGNRKKIEERQLQ